MSIYSQIFSEYAHECAYTVSTENALCKTCISDEEDRVMRRENTRKSRGKMCECELQSCDSVYTCSVCEEVKQEIKFLQSEIINVSAKHAVDVVETFVVNPMFQQTLEQYAFRCRMMKEFLLCQRINLLNSGGFASGFPRKMTTRETHQHNPYEFHALIEPTESQGVAESVGGDEDEDPYKNVFSRDSRLY
jgi:hypothetical protein